MINIKGDMKFLRLPKKKLFYILFYTKCYPTFDPQDFCMMLDRSQPCRWSGAYLSMLEKRRKKDGSVQRRISIAEEFIRLFPEIREVFTDGTSRTEE